MANLPESETYDSGVYQLETTDPCEGGENGVDNAPLKNLANRTKYLKAHMDALETAADGFASIDSQEFTGTPRAPTQAKGDSSTLLANTEFVQGAVGGRLVKSVAGNTNVTLTAVEAGNAILEFNGVLTGNIAVIVPTSPTRSWIVKNGTSGAYTVTVKTASGTGQICSQGTNALVFTDGTNVYDVLTDFEFIVDKDSSTGAANMPAGTTAQRGAVTAGRLRFNNDLLRYEGANGATWGSLGGATGGASDAVFYLNDQTVNNDYTIPANQNAMSAGPITVADGRSVTISDGSVWTVV